MFKSNMNKLEMVFNPTIQKQFIDDRTFEFKG
jgi:hypothetical protein